MAPRYCVNFSTETIHKEYCEYLVIGSGIAGLYTALKISQWAPVTLLTKRKLGDSNTERAQGGIAAAIDRADSPVLHFEDTIEAGAGLCSVEAVEVLVNEGPQRVMELMALGARFDKKEGDALSLTREGAHSRHRILHAGDATGGEIHRALEDQVTKADNITIYEDHFVIDLLTENKTCYGALVWGGPQREMKIFLSSATILATGGAGQVYENTTNPEVATGDGIAVAYRAGAQVMDMEFVQFHPTALYRPGKTPFLISEALRGEGAIMRNSFNERFMSHYHPMGELAPRDVVSRAILEETVKTKTPYVYLDLTHLDGTQTKKRFPNITERCAQKGIDIAKDFIPVAPAAHYSMGGVRTNLYGETNLAGLYACGEVACLAVHGANRLASNSLVDGLVFGERIAYRSRDYVAGKKLMEFPSFAQDEGESQKVTLRRIKRQLQELMWEKVGIIRSGEDLNKAMAWLGAQEKALQGPFAAPEEVELLNLLTVGKLVAQGAQIRTESRGGHYRRDYPKRDDILWKRHIILQR